MSKRKRRDLDLSSSSGSSDCIYDSSLWKFVEENYEFLMNDDLLEHCKNNLSCEQISTPASSSYESCVILLEGLSDLLHNLRQRIQSDGPGNFQKYLETTITNEIQHYEKRKHSIINSILSTLNGKFQSPLSSSELQNFSMAFDPTSDEFDKKSSHVLRTLGDLQQEWDEIIHKITPINPLINQTKFVEDIDSDLKKIDAWLDTLASNLPNTSAWMTCLMSLSNVQKFSSAKYYQVCLKQIEQYSKTLSTIKQLIDRIEINTLADIQFQNNLHTLSKSVCELEAKCHTLWLRLLELSIYIDQNIKINLDKPVNTDIYHDACLTNPKHDGLHENHRNDYLSEFNITEIGTHHVTQQNGHESGFESEQSPPLVKPYYSYSCNDNITSTDVYMVKDELALRKDSTRSLPNDFNQIIGKLNNGLLNDESRARCPETINIDNSVKCLSSQNDLCLKNNDGCEINNYEEKSFSLLEQRDVEQNSRLEISEEDVLLDNTKNNFINVTMQTNESHLSDSKHTTGFILHQKHSGVFSNKLVTKFSNLDKVQNSKPIHKCCSLPVVKSSVTGMNKSKSVDWSFLTNRRQLDAKSYNTHVYIMNNNNNNRLRRTTSGQKSLINTYNNLHKFYDLKRIGNNHQLTRHLLDFNVQHKNIKSRSTKFSKNYHKKKVLKNRNSISRKCMSSTSLNLSNQLTNPLFNHTKSTVSQYGSVKTQLFHFDSRSDSDSEVISNQSYYRNSIPDNASDMEQRQWRMQVRTYLNAAEKAEELIRNRYSPTRFESWLAGLEASSLKLDENNDNNNNQNQNENVNNATINEELSVKKNQNTCYSYSSFMNDLDGIKSEKNTTFTDDDDGDDNMSPVEDSHDPLLNFWDDYQASLYSNSTDTQAYEPTSIYAEEFPWDDVESQLITDIEHELNSPSSHSHTEPVKFRKSNSDDIIEGNDNSKVEGQDTNDILSTSTSILFNQKSSFDASFEIFNNTSTNYTRGTENWSAEHTDNLLSPESSVRGLRTCPDGGSQHLLSMDTMDAVSNHEIQDIKNRLQPMRNFSEQLNSSKLTYHTRHDIKLHSKLYERKYQTVPRITNRKRKAQINSFQLENQSIKREFLSVDVNLHHVDNRYFIDIHKGILENSETRLLHAEIYLQHLVNSMKRKNKLQQKNLSKQVNSGIWRHRTAHLVQTAEAHVKLLSNLLDDLKSYCSSCSNISNVSDDRVSASFTQDLTSCKNDNDYMKIGNFADDDDHHSPYHFIISTALKLKSRWTNFASTVRHIYHQSNQYETWKKQLFILQLRMHDLSRLTRQIGLSMYTSKEGNSENDNHINTHHIYDSMIDDENQSDKITHSFKRCFLEVDSLNFALEEIQNELNKENYPIPVNNNNNSSTVCNTISLDGKLLHEIDRLSSQLAINRSILQRLIRLFESNHSNNPSTHHLDNEYLTNNIENDSDTPCVNTDESIQQEKQVSEVIVNEHLNKNETDEICHQQPSVSVSTSTNEEKSSIYTSICNLLRRIFPPINNQSYFVLLISGFIFLVYLCYYIFTKLITCNNNSRRPLCPTTTTTTSTVSSLRCFFSSTNNHSNDHHNNPHHNPLSQNDNIHAATIFNRCPLERDSRERRTELMKEYALIRHTDSYGKNSISNKVIQYDVNLKRINENIRKVEKMHEILKCQFEKLKQDAKTESLCNVNKLLNHSLDNQEFHRVIRKTKQILNAHEITLKSISFNDDDDDDADDSVDDNAKYEGSHKLSILTKINKETVQNNDNKHGKMKEESDEEVKMMETKELKQHKPIDRITFKDDESTNHIVDKIQSPIVLEHINYSSDDFAKQPILLNSNGLLNNDHHDMKCDSNNNSQQIVINNNDDDDDNDGIQEMEDQEKEEMKSESVNSSRDVNENAIIPQDQNLDQAYKEFLAKATFSIEDSTYDPINESNQYESEFDSKILRNNQNINNDEMQVSNKLLFDSTNVNLLSSWTTYKTEDLEDDSFYD
ncbi:unnamed protein product [Schistosoma turkestanicum]|nr:unnamed protein product [Schistosoma turkestanicum]